MNKFILLTLSFLLTFFITPSVFAQQFAGNEYIVLPKNAVVNTTYFAAGKNIVISGTINGDAYVAGGEVIVEGTINGDLLIAGGNVTIRGTVTDDVRAAGGNVTISGNVGKNLTVAGGNVTVAESANIQGDVVGGSGNIKIFGPVAHNVIVGGGNITLSQRVGGNAVLGGKNIDLTSTASVLGNLTYYSGQQANIQQGAVITGRTDYHQTETRVEKHRAAAAAGSGRVFMKMISFLSSLILGLILVNLAPVFSLQAAAMLQKNLWASMGIGLLMLILAPIIVVILAATIIGLPLAFFALFLFLLAIYVSKIFVSLWVGQRVLGYWQKKPHLAWSLVAGLLLWAVATSIPVIGGLLGFLSCIAGLGALFLQRRVTYLSLRTKKLI